jgi:GDP-4-dehydro-6-deoxy-D-mannose reductase
MPPHKLLITGAAGFVGYWAWQHTQHHRRDTKLYATDRANKPDWVPEDRYIQADLRDIEAVGALIESVQPTQVLHLASRLAPTTLDEYRACNVTATANLYDALQENPNVNPKTLRIVQVGSAAIYGRIDPADLPIRESQPLAPLSPYAISKAEQDQLAEERFARDGLPIIRARVFNLLGPGQPAHLVPMTFVTQCRDLLNLREKPGESLHVGDITTRRDFIDVRDAVARFDLLLQTGQPGQAYNIASGQDVAIEEILHQLLKIAHLDVPIESCAQRRRDTDVPVVRAEIAKLNRLLRDTTPVPAIPLEASLQDQWNSLLHNTPSS